jgi:tRNA dimethylallyltransferase
VAGSHVAIVGCTASGKSRIGLELARRLGDTEIVSIDSMQVYRGMDIGTAKPTPQEQAEIPHHLIDLVDPWDDFSIAEFQAAYRHVIGGIEDRGKRALLVGGTGLYVQAVVDDIDLPGQFPEARAEIEAEPDTLGLHRRLAELDPTAAARMEPNNRRRVVRALEVTIGSGRPFSSFGPGIEHFPPTSIQLVGLRVERPELDRRIADRYAGQLDAGFLDEVRSLTELARPLSRSASQALGYKELLDHVVGDVPVDEVLETAIIRTRQFARRQERWFRRDPRITWVAAGSDDNPLVEVLTHLQG